MIADDPTAAARVTPDMIANLHEHANKLAWKSPDLNVLRPELAGQYVAVTESLQEHIKRADRRQRLVLPDLRAFGNQTVALFSDYGGESQDAKYLTYSTLICGWNLTSWFLEMMKIVRAEHGLGTKEIAFKDFRMGQLQRSLPGYLAALNAVPGFLFTVAIDKRLATLFGPDTKESREEIARQLRELDVGERKPDVNEKLLRVVHIAAFLTGLLAHDGQNIFWMTDDDSISPTPEMHEKTLKLFELILPNYLRAGYTFPQLGGALPFKERHLETLDLLSATDIVAGALDQYLAQRDKVAPEDILVKQGCDRVLQWLAHDGLGLKKMNILMRPGANRAIEAVTLELELTDPPKDGMVIPISV
jgi:hypothetical protein